MAINTPPMTPALAAAGAGAVLRRGARRAADALANSEPRFQLPLAACLTLTLAALAVFKPNAIEGWRQRCFLYAPTCLLAVCGLDALIRAARRLGERRLGLLCKSASASAIAGGSICAAAFGFALTAREMVNMRPFQYICLNRFVDRETPEYPRALYDMSYWGISNLQGADFYITHCRERFRMSGVYGEPFKPVLHESRVYDNAVMSVLAVNLDMLDNETRAARREMKRDTLAGENPIIRAEWDVYLRDGAPVYLKESCAEG